MSEFASWATWMVGLFFALLISVYFYRSSVRRSLTPYIQHASRVFGGVDSAIKRDLAITYKGVVVDELTDFQFIVANSGRRAIRDVIRPLTLEVRDADILDASILHVHPEGRVVEVSHSGSVATFKFDVMNGGEFFIVKILARGGVSSANLNFKITVDDLPPTLPVQRLDEGRVDVSGGKSFVPGALLFGLTCILACISLAYGSYLLFLAMEIGGFDDFRMDHIPVVISCLVGWGLGALFFVIGLGFSLASFSGGVFPPRRRYLIPDFARRNPSLN